ncbi:HAMP domain-containing histidine kinase [Cryobacterium sp. Hh11]|nr:HAMP domain-containing histidine kinase [Cryobacterium sp. Hh11]
MSMARHYEGYARSLLEFQIVMFGALLAVGTALLLMLLIIWIAYSFGPWGFVICLALVAATSPSSFFAGYADFDSKQFTHLVAFPLTMVIMSAAAGVSGTRIHRKRRELAAKTALTEQAVRARDDLIEAVTHELRTPLTSILGNADLVLRASEQAQMVERRAGVIVRGVEQMETILADLLLARSTGTSQLELHRAATDIRVLIDHSRAASRAAADARQVTIDVTAASGLDRLASRQAADAGFLGQNRLRRKHLLHREYPPQNPVEDALDQVIDQRRSTHETYSLVPARRRTLGSVYRAR